MMYRYNEFEQFRFGQAGLLTNHHFAWITYHWTSIYVTGSIHGYCAVTIPRITNLPEI